MDNKRISCGDTTLSADRAFYEMLKHARESLVSRSPEDIAGKAGAEYVKETSSFRVKSLSQMIDIELHGFEIRQKLNHWHHLLVLHYLSLADGMPVSPQWISFGELKDGLIRGTKFAHTVTEQLGNLFGELSQGKAEDICRLLGAEIVESRADLCAVFPFLPRYPIMLNLWFGDEEFPASARLLVQKNADHYLTVEDAVTAGEFIISLCKEAKLQ